MTADPTRLDEVFAAALAETAPGGRAAFLDRACAGDPRLRARVDALLAAHEASGDFLSLPTGDGIVPLLLAERPGAMIGRYKLLEEIGEGGFGVVFMAEQEQPVRRRVALKIIKVGMDSRQVVARFEAERQALAMMDHPNIAKVLDGGSTDSGRPYFVMELIKGTPITEFCDGNGASIARRLELFAQVCQAVQHAHQKGLIHRDIKPTNVLVATHDDRPTVKVIDFGVAKAMQSRLTEKTLFTEFHQLIGTPAYMSPEQASGGLDIDTRSDVYSLGVLLYEVLTGLPPFDPKELRSKAFVEMQRIICEVDPPTPSTRLTALIDTLPSVAAQRSIEPRKLASTIRGELDWIVMRCLEKDRNRRYQTASALADDLQNYLTDQPVEARRATRAYRFRKFIRRNKVAAFAGTAIFLALSAGVVAASYFAANASREAHRAESARVKAELNERKADGVTRFFSDEVFGLADPNRFDRAGITLVEALDIAASKVDDKFPNDGMLRAELRDRLGNIYFGIDHPLKATTQLEEAVRLRSGLMGENDVRTLRSRGSLGFAYYRLGHLQQARDVLAATWRAQSNALGPGHEETVVTALRLSVVHMQMRGVYTRWSALPPEGDEDLEVARAGFEAAKKNLGPHHDATLRIENQLSWALRWRNRSEEAFPYAEEAAVGMRRLKGSEDLDTLFSRYSYACCLYDVGRYAESAAEFAGISAARQRMLGPAHIDTLATEWQRSRALIKSGQRDEAIILLEAVHEELDEIKSQKGVMRAEKMVDFFRTSRDMGRMDLAMEFLIASDELASVPPDDATAHRNYAALLSIISAEMTSFPPTDALDTAARSVELAQKAVALAPEYAFHWRTLAAATYRSEDWRSAIDAFSKAEELDKDVAPADALMLAIAHQHLGRRGKAREWYDKAMQGMSPALSEDENLIRLREEAAQLMGIPSQNDVPE